MNKIISELYDKIDAQDKIINEQALEIAKLKEEKAKAIEYIKENDLYVYIPDNDLNMDYEELANDKLLEILEGNNNE